MSSLADRVEQLVQDAREGYACEALIPHRGAFRWASHNQPDKAQVCMLTAAYCKHHNITSADQALNTLACDIADWAEVKYGVPNWIYLSEPFDKPDREYSPIYEPIVKLSKELFPQA